MKYLIKIKRSSIKKNPNAGRTQSRVCTGRTTTFKCPGVVPELMQDEDKVLIGSYTMKGGAMVDATGYIKDESIIMDIFDLNQGIEINIKNDWQKINHKPEPTYFYSYIDRFVKCNVCRHTFSMSKLQSDCLYGDNDEIFSDRICPLCNTWDCCELEYENLNNAMK